MATQIGAIYARISQEDENVPKVEIQEAVCRALALDHGIDIVKVYVDNGIPATGKSIREGTRDKRPGFDALLKDAAAGNLNVILAVAGDRMARNYPDGLDIVEAAQDGGLTLLFEDDGVIDPRTPAGEERAMALFTGGRKEIRQRSARQRRRNEAERQKGMPLWGRRPFGFSGDRVPNAKGKETVRWTKHEPIEAEAVRWAYEFFLKPEGTLYGIAEEFKRRGLRTAAAGYKWKKAGEDKPFRGEWTGTSIRALLKNPIYAGMLQSNGEIVRDTDGSPISTVWDPFVSRETWEAVQLKLANPARRTNAGRKHHGFASGIVFCNCGYFMRTTTISHMGERVPGLRCDVHRMQDDDRKARGPHVSMRLDVLEPVIAREVANAFLFGPANLIPHDGVDVTHLEVEMNEIHSARARLIKLIAAGAIDEDEATAELVAGKARLAELETERGEAASKSAQAAMLVDLRSQLWKDGKVPLDKAAEANTALVERFNSLPLAQKRELVRTLLHVRILPAPGARSGQEKRIQVKHLVVTSLNEESE